MKNDIAHNHDFAALERETFLETFKYKLIYVYSIDDKKHEGYLKVGDTDVVSSLTPDSMSKRGNDLFSEAVVGIFMLAVLERLHTDMR